MTNSTNYSANFSSNRATVNSGWDVDGPERDFDFLNSSDYAFQVADDEISEYDFSN